MKVPTVVLVEGHGVVAGGGDDDPLPGMTDDGEGANWSYRACREFSSTSQLTATVNLRFFFIAEEATDILHVMLVLN